MIERALLLLSLSCGFLSASAQFIEKAEFEGGFERAATDGPRTVWVNPIFCRFVIDLSVDRSGRVLSAAVNIPLSSCSDTALVNKANALARTYVFSPNALAPEPQAVRFVWAVGERPKYEDLFANEPGPDMLPPPEPAAESERIWTVVEVPPQFPGGHEVMRTYLERMVQYPTDAEPPLREGMVLVGFVVNAEGLVEDVNVIKGLGYPYDSEARRVAKAMPKWIPGMQNGHAVRTRYEMPVVFKLPSGTVFSGGQGTGSGTGNGPGKQEPITIVEEMPEFPGGPEALYPYIREILKYPEKAIEQGVEGIVYLTFVVEKDGSVSNIKVLRSIGYGCDEEALRIVRGMPKWKPGKQRGVPVRVQYNLPIRFKL
jgi:TonB family protein